MSDLMLDIMMWLLFLIVIALCIFVLFLTFYFIKNLMTNATKKKLKKYKIGYIIKDFKLYCERGCYVEAKNKKQAIKEFRKYYIYICDVKEIE